MSKKLKIIIILVFFALLLGGAAFGVWTKIKNSLNEEGDKLSDLLGQKSPGGGVAENDSGGQAQIKTFSHPVYRFSFNYPEGWSAESFLEEEGEAVLVQSQNEESGIAVFVYPFDEAGPLTKKRILRDVPDMKMENETTLKIVGLDALGFDNNQREFGPTKEVWFVYNGFLYEISAALGSGEVLYMMVESWKFQ